MYYINKSQQVVVENVLFLVVLEVAVPVFYWFL